MGVKRAVTNISQKKIANNFSINKGVNIPKQYSNIINKLNLGFDDKELFIVGGAVRDILLNKEIKDLDFATNALPEETYGILGTIADLSDKGNPLVWRGNERFGTITAVIDGEQIEITTYRTDERYSNNSRKPEVTWGKSITEDMERRDYTINAIALNTKTNTVFDPLDGIKDLQIKTIKAVGDPNKRFKEDPLRMLRGIKLVSGLGFKMDRETFLAIKRNAHLIKNVSAERKRDELSKILIGENPDIGIDLTVETKLIDHIIPEIKPMVNMGQPTKYHNKDVYRHTLKVLKSVPSNERLRWAALLHDIGKPDTYSITESGVIHFYGHQNEGAKMAKQILQRLKMPKEDTMAISHMVRQHMQAHRLTKGLNKDGYNVATVGEDGIPKKTVERLVNNLDYWVGDKGKEKLLVSAEEILELNKGDILGGNPKRTKHALRSFEQTKKMIEEVRYERNNKKPAPAINGNDIMKKFKLEPGPDVGGILNALQSKVNDGILSPTDKETSYKEAAKYIENTLGKKVIASPLTGKEIMERFNVSPGPELGKAIKYLEKLVESGSLSFDEKEKAYGEVKKILDK